MWYILKYKKPIESTAKEHCKWSKRNPKQRVVKQEFINDCKISTIFLGLNEGFKGGLPILWETMIFGGKENLYLDRYTSYKDAVIGHQKAVNLIKNG